MSSMTFGQKPFQVIPPEKGAFPLDHAGECKSIMVSFMRCLHDNKNVNAYCREEARQYLDCRMKNNLMAKEEWRNLGYPEFDEKLQNENKS
ncbi:hypothetical protein LSH36_6g05066 [Paralvinella palmiformis]|uniref:CHCH domain-containing protein n=1 Tax=Paralvinella palmiformis TaxID=53620 RepID=A0AAD9KDX7_9ANNE|nr:hypothetical protein LSH36_6g05066 [Paralvinella palmiformis]